MPYFQLSSDIEFLPVFLAEPDGLIALGGDLSSERLLLAYQSGIFPWYSEGDPILWYSPDPRFVIYPDTLKTSKSMKQVLGSGRFHITYDKDFEGVIRGCKTRSRKGQEGTWITDDMEKAFIEMHRLGFAHSVETWREGKLVGGLYGIVLGKYFCGESMFALESNASKAAFLSYAQKIFDEGFGMIDCQTYTPHLQSLGAVEVERTVFLKEMKVLILDN